jgi:ABC-type nickel/cobalt efflux system permease component RcnA
MAVRVWVGCAFLLLTAGSLSLAHPVDPKDHDRTITVHLSGDAQTGEAVVRVEYRLEVDENTAILEDLRAVKKKLNLSDFHNQPDRFYGEFARVYAPILGANLDGRVDGQTLRFSPQKYGHRLKDERGRSLGHLRCDFVFQARARLRPVKEHTLFFKERNYHQDVYRGLVLLSFTSRKPIHVLKKAVPDKALQDRPATEREPGDEDRLRTVTATFVFPPLKVENTNPGTGPTREPRAPPSEAKSPGNEEPEEEGFAWPSNLTEFLRMRQALPILLLLAFLYGAGHAVMPGHGKALVAAYLVGERGTVWHALWLGLITTLTHTGVVILVAVGLIWFFPSGRISHEDQQGIQTGLEMVGGVVVACLGFWLFLRRLSGKADHFHLGGHSHHHHHGPGHHHHHHGSADHYHDEQGHAHPLPGSTGQVSRWSLLVMGITGGLVPCWGAIFLLLAAVILNRLWLALPVLLAFSAGLAGVLVLIGILVVRVKGFAGSRLGEGRLFQILPIISAVVITLLGLGLCIHAAHGG